MKNPITERTIELHQKDCDKCCGTGKIHDGGIRELIRRWRSSLDITAKTFAGLVKVPYESYCKFENGHVVFSEARIRILIQMLTIIQEDKQNENLA